MKRFITSKYYLILCSLAMLVFFLFACLCFIHDYVSILEETSFGLGFLWCGLFLILMIFFAFGLNRLACVVQFENNMIKRRGLFRGFQGECKIEDVTKIEIRNLYRDGDFIFFIDGRLKYSDRMFDRFRKNSYICIKKSKKNLDFIHCYFEKDILVSEMKNNQ